MYMTLCINNFIIIVVVFIIIIVIAFNQNEYNKLSNQCKNYAVELLDLCRSTDEIGAILNGGDVSDDVNAVPSLTRVKLAIKYGQKRVST